MAETRLRAKAVAYINTDGNGRGFLNAGGSHTLEGLVGATVKGNEVETVGIIIDGQPLAYAKGTPNNEAKLTKDGSKYMIAGSLTGMPDMSNPMAGPSKHDFTMDVTCP